MSTAAPLALSRERILRCAVQVADREGLDAASLRKVASELGVHVTSLYNHLPTKEALLDGVVEELFAEADLPMGGLPWDEWVRRFVTAIATMAREHPGAFAVLLRRPAQGSRAAETFEAGLAAFHRAGLDVTESYAAVKAVALGVLGCCAEQATLAMGEVPTTDLAGLSRREFPTLHAARGVAGKVDVVAALSDVLVGGLALRLTRVP